MKITQEEVVDRQTVLHIELEDDDLDPYLDRGYAKVVQRTLIPGFRKGKAPRRIVENFLGREALINEVLDSMVPEVTGKAIQEQKLDAAGLPQIELVELDPLTLKAVVPLTPDIDLGQYKDIRVEKESSEVTEEDIQQRLEQMQHSMASWEPVERPVQMGDMVTIQASGTVDGKAVMDQKDAVFLVDGDGQRPVPGFSDQLVGAKRDEPFTFSITPPEDFYDTNVAGEEVSFEVTVTEAKERILPELDDEFAKGVGEGYESFEALRKQVEEDAKEETESAGTLKHREAVVQALIEGASFELAPVMVDHEVTHMMDERQRILAQANIRLDDYLQSMGKTNEDLQAELRDESSERLKRTFALTQLAEAEEIEVTEAEVDERIESAVSGAAGQEERGPVSDELKSSVERMLLAEKTIDRLVVYASGEKPSETAEESSSDEAAQQEQENGSQDETQDDA